MTSPRGPVERIVGRLRDEADSLCSIEAVLLQDAASLIESQAAEIQRLQAALDPVREWDVARAMDGLKLSGSIDFALPQSIREKLQSALPPNAGVKRPSAEGV
jgi:hypothetical protein